MGIKLVSSSGGSVELNAPVTASNYTMTVPANNGTVITTASTFAGTGPAFSAYQNVAQTSIANLTFTKLNLQAKEFDTATCFDATTNYRFTPNVAGYYQVSGQALCSPSASGMVLISIYKNGTRFKDGLATPNGSSIAAECVVSSLVYMNGSTDYVELYFFQSSGSAMSLQSNAPSSNYFQAFLARSA